MITKPSAIKIAKEAISGKIELQEGAPIDVILKAGFYVVIFKRINPPGIRGADYDAMVTVNAKTGEVIEILGGP